LNRETGNIMEAARLQQRAEDIRMRNKVTYAPIAQVTE
jgi:hypothetical protein